MDFLSKKSWHPSRLQNIEKVWKAEQVAASEEQKLKELQRQLQEERQIEDLKRVQAASGYYKPRQERLDWMYEGAKPVGPSAEEYLEGKEFKSQEEEKPANELGLFQNKTLSSEQDTWNKLREDPVLEMKKREKMARDFIKNNPMKMAMIKKQLLGMEKQRKEEKKKRKKEKKSKHSRKRSRSRSDDDDISKDKESRKRKKSRHDKDSDGERSDKNKKKKDKHRHHHRHRGDKREDEDNGDGGHRHKSEDRREPDKTIKRGYGLTLPNDAKAVELKKEDIRDIDAAKADLLEQKRKQREERDREARRKREERRQRQSQRRRLTDEERQKMLEEMQQDANVNEQRRDARLKRYQEAASQREAEDERKDTTINFLNEEKKRAYSTEGLGGLADRMKRTQHYRMRGNLEGANTFKR